ncbi:GNAT family N-acetyltransferase [Ureibacillus acetophenoni]|uniref:L-amino acid N-acyltransferase YncA n=1 Tax=Ureibacillus acetophenoni TaxID=614649 RepID=A0A285USK4_9BACL|nr:GNAT family N-acetyltransferase [Ureibacillus acetophenoni]SOC44677.1 L-amino acid N-acyltransferase YncA [Ureibacillus acetophenoni]
MTIRLAKLEDAEGIAKVHVDSWRTTYEGIIPQEFLNNLSYDKRAELWIRNITKPETHIYVAENAEGKIVGFADFWKRETNTVPNSTDLTSIYLLKEYQGQGLGKKLLEQLFLQIKQLGYEKVFVEVLEENKTCSFYERYGAKLYNTVSIQIGGKLLSERIYVWENVEDVLDKLTHNEKIK